VWKRLVNGRELHFYLAGINNQNFLMRDRETGSWWQQITGKAVYGPLQGAALDLVLSDELTFGEWRSEFPRGKVLAPVARYMNEYDSNWEPEVAKLPVVISFPGAELKSRDVVVGVDVGGGARAYPWDVFVKQSPLMDRVSGVPLLLVLGPDRKSFRVFISRIDGRDAEFFLQTTDTNPSEAPPVARRGVAGSGSEPNSSVPAKSIMAEPWTLIDSVTGSQWNFQGCAISGPSLGKCLDRVPALKDYWFDWRNYHADTTIYRLQ
jgi:Protein of unknown function (DUF3179)